MNNKFADGAACVKWPHDLQPTWHVDDQGFVTGVDVHCYLYASLPIWDYYSSASDAAKAAWDTCSRAHRARAGPLLDRLQRRAGTRGSIVNRSKADAETRLRELVAELDADQKKFDDDTDHGRNTGVTLDWSSDDDDFPAR